MWGRREEARIVESSSPFRTVPACNRQTQTRTQDHSIAPAWLHAVLKLKQFSFSFISDMFACETSTAGPPDGRDGKMAAV